MPKFKRCLQGDMMNTNTVVGLFDYYSNADGAVKALQKYGVGSERISVIARDSDTMEPGNAGGTAAAIGAAAGGLFGLLAGLSTLVIPGIGPVLATGTLAGTLAIALGMSVLGAGFGAATGGILGAFIDLGFSAEDAEIYAEGLKRGAVLVSVEANIQDEDEADEIKDILRRAGAVDLATRRKTWQDQGWTSFEETEKSEQEYRR
jgi:hypothetical protein